MKIQYLFTDFIKLNGSTSLVELNKKKTESLFTEEPPNNINPFSSSSLTFSKCCFSFDTSK